MRQKLVFQVKENKLKDICSAHHGFPTTEQMNRETNRLMKARHFRVGLDYITPLTTKYNMKEHSTDAYAACFSLSLTKELVSTTVCAFSFFKKTAQVAG